MMRSLLLLALLMLVSPVGAVVPDIRLPAWHRLDLLLKPGPKPETVSLIVRLQAPLTDVRDLSVSIQIPQGMKTTPTTQVRPLLKAGDIWEATFEANVSPGLNGWVDVAAAGRPDIPQLERWLADVATYTGTSRLILQEEIRRFTEPAQIGRTFPLTVTAEGAVLMPREFLFQAFPLGKSEQLFVWAPDGEFSLPAPKRALRDLRVLLQREQWSKAAASARALQGAIQNAAELTFMAADQRRMTLAKDLLNGCMAVSIQALEALAGNQEAALKQLVQLSADPLTRPHTAFLWANLGALHAANGKTAEAREAFTKALEIIPSWKTLQNRLNQIRSGGGQ